MGRPSLVLAFAKGLTTGAGRVDSRSWGGIVAAACAAAPTFVSNAKTSPDAGPGARAQRCLVTLIDNAVCAGDKARAVAIAKTWRHPCALTTCPAFRQTSEEAFRPSRASMKPVRASKGVGRLASRAMWLAATAATSLSQRPLLLRAACVSAPPDGCDNLCLSCASR